jgi:hypothetical protein
LNRWRITSGVDRAAVGPGEDADGGGVVAVEEDPFGVLLDLPGAQGGNRDGVEGKHAGRVVGLAVAVLRPTINHDAGIRFDGKGPGVQVDSRPAQPAQLRATQAGGGGEEVEGVEAVGANVGEEGAQLGRGPDGWLAAAHLGRFDLRGDVLDDITLGGLRLEPNHRSDHPDPVKPKRTL